MIKSKFWRARDLEGQRPVILTIADVTEELMGRGRQQDVKCFLWFKEHLKGLQLNKSRVLILEMAYGPDSELWVNHRVKLSYDPTVMFGDKPVGGVRLETPAGIVYQGPASLPGWGDAPAAVPGRPPAPVWDDKRQMWITPTPPAASPAAAKRPPAPVWNDATQQWETVDTATGEMTPPKHVPPPTISERVNAGQQPATDVGWGALPSTQGAPEFDDDIPF